MKILWLVNIVMPELAEYLGRKPSVFGGWLTGALNAVRAEGNEFVICSAEHTCRQQGRYMINGTVYYLEQQSDLSCMEQRFHEILGREKPDVIHVFGTEYVQSLAMARAADKERLLITVQGALTRIYPTTFAGIPERICRDNLLHRVLRRCHKGGESIELQKNSFEKRARLEREALCLAKYIHGGSQWGNRFAKQINPNCQTFDCGLILRDPFYTDLRWNQDNCEKHSITAIFTYPLKGFHQLLRAMPRIIEQFPDVKLHAVGHKLNVRRYHGLKRIAMDFASDYNWYVQGLLDKYHLWGNVVFDGYLNALEMRERLLESNAFVAPSAMENQCTALGEALMLGIPCIATRAGAMPEYVADGESALLYDFEDIDQLAAGICRIFADREFAEKLSDYAPVLPGKLYDKDANGRKLIEVYHMIDCNAKEVRS